MRPRRKFTPEFKMEAMNLAMSVGVESAMKSLDICGSVLRRWLDQAGLKKIKRLRRRRRSALTARKAPAPSRAKTPAGNGQSKEPFAAELELLRIRLSDASEKLTQLMTETDKCAELSEALLRARELAASLRL